MSEGRDTVQLRVDQLSDGPDAVSLSAVMTGARTTFRRRWRESVGSGFEYGLCCVGSSIGLMLMLVAVSVMSIGWMSVIAALVLAQTLLPARAAVDVPLALAIIGLGVLIVIVPSTVPGLTPPM